MPLHRTNHGDGGLDIKSIAYVLPVWAATKCAREDRDPAWTAEIDWEDNSPERRLQLRIGYVQNLKYNVHEFSSNICLGYCSWGTAACNHQRQIRVSVDSENHKQAIYAWVGHLSGSQQPTRIEVLCWAGRDGKHIIDQTIAGLTTDIPEHV